MLATRSLIELEGTGYIAGTQEGVVKKGGVRASAAISVLDADTLAVVMIGCSTINGNYMLSGLDESKKYLVMARDVIPESGEPYAPKCWDAVPPFTDLTVIEQQELWDSWQT